MHHNIAYPQHYKNYLPVPLYFNRSPGFSCTGTPQREEKEDSRYKQAGGVIRVSEEMDGSHDKQAGGGMRVSEEMEDSRYRHVGGGMMAREEMDGSRYRQAGGDMMAVSSILILPAWGTSLCRDWIRFWSPTFFPLAF